MTDKRMTAEESMHFIDETIKCTLQSLYEVNKSVGKVEYAKNIAYAMCHIETSINILRRTEEDLKFHLVKYLKNDRCKKDIFEATYEPLEKEGD